MTPKTNVEQKRKWIAFTCFGAETRANTKLLRNTKTGIECRTRHNKTPPESKTKMLQAD
jgi:hypothetical protein